MKTNQTARRAAIAALMQDRPAIRAEAIARTLREPLATIRDDLTEMAKEGRLARLSSGTLVHPDYGQEWSGETLGLSAVERRAEILNWLDEQPVAPSSRAMTRRFGVTLPTVASDIRMLMREGVLKRDPDRARAHSLVGTRQTRWEDPRAHVPFSQAPSPLRKAPSADEDA